MHACIVLLYGLSMAQSSSRKIDLGGTLFHPSVLLSIRNQKYNIENIYKEKNAINTKQNKDLLHAWRTAGMNRMADLVGEFFKACSGLRNDFDFPCGQTLSFGQVLKISPPCQYFGRLT